MPSPEPVGFPALWRSKKMGASPVEGAPAADHSRQGRSCSVHRLGQAIQIRVISIEAPVGLPSLGLLDGRSALWTGVAPFASPGLGHGRGSSPMEFTLAG